jgi:hypothetical protein
MNPGDVVFIWLEAAHLGGQPDFKYCISVDTKEKRFFLINSEARKLTPTQNVSIGQAETTFLSHDSFVDVSRLIGLTAGEFRSGMATRRGGRSAKDCGPLDPSIIRRLLPTVTASNTLPKWQKELVIRNLCAQLAKAP